MLTAAPVLFPIALAPASALLPARGSHIKKIPAGRPAGILSSKVYLQK